MALVVAGVPTVSAGAATRDTTVLAVRLAGAGTRGAPVVVSAVRNDGELGAAQVTRVVDTRSTNARGDAVLRADPAALAAFVDDTGVVNFELMTVADGTPRFTSFSRQWTGVGWVDRDGVPVAAPVVLSTSQPAASPDRASGAMVHVKLAPRAAGAASEVPCYWYDDSAGDASTKVGEFHTGRNTEGNFTYGRGADSDISVGYDYGTGWTLGGAAHVSNSRESAIVFNRHSNFHHQLRSYFRYVHWHLTLGPSCASSKNFGKRYKKVTPGAWVGGSAVGSGIKGPFCRGRSGRVPHAPNTEFYRGEKRAYTYSAAVGAWGAALSATSGYSTRVDMHWKFGKNRKVGHWLCGRPDVNHSKIVYAS